MSWAGMGVGVDYNRQEYFQVDVHFQNSEVFMFAQAYKGTKSTWIVYSSV